MPGLREEDDFQPLGWVGQMPIFATTLLVAVYIAAVAGTSIARAAGLDPLFLQYDAADIFQHFAFWQFLTYPLYQLPTLWLLIELYLLYAFGREVEKFLGRRAFLQLYGLLWLAVPCLLTAAGFWLRTGMAGSRALNFAVFIAFATLYPNARMMFGLITKWVALALVALAVLQALAFRDVIGAVVLLFCSAIAYGFIRRSKGQELWPFHQEEEPRSIFSDPPRRARRLKPPKQKEDPAAAVDKLLEKVSKNGLQSLTTRERARLEQASRELASRERKR